MLHNNTWQLLYVCCLHRTPANAKCGSVNKIKYHGLSSFTFFLWFGHEPSWPRYLGLWVCGSVSKQVSTQAQGDAARRREVSYDVARLLLMAPIDPWRNSTPVFGSVAFCTTKDCRTPLTSTSSTISSTYSSQKRSLRWTRSKKKSPRVFRFGPEFFNVISISNIGPNSK